MTDSEKVALIRSMIQDFWGMTEGSGEANAALVAMEMIGTVADFGGGDD